MSEKERKAVRDIRKNVFRANRLLGKPAKCFGLSLTLKRMLAMRGMQTSLYLGVNKDEAGNLLAHAWLMNGGETLYGGKHASEKFARLITLT